MNAVTYEGLEVSSWCCKNRPFCSYSKTRCAFHCLSRWQYRYQRRMQARCYWRQFGRRPDHRNRHCHFWKTSRSNIDGRDHTFWLNRSRVSRSRSSL